MGRKKRRRSTNTSYDDSKMVDVSQAVNEDLEKYYKLQKVVAEEEWDDFIAAMRKPLTSAFRLNRTSPRFKELERILDEDHFKLREIEKEGFELQGLKFTAPTRVKWNPLAWSMSFPRSKIRRVEKLKPFRAWLMKMTELGEITRQELVSMLPVQVLDVQSHHAVLDMCAAPGSKTTQLLEKIHTDKDGGLLAKPSGFVIANDPDYKRGFTLSTNIQRLTLPNFMIIGRMGQCIPNILIEQKDKSGPPRTLMFDRILCDVPCSGDGTIRKNPDIWMTWTRNDGNCQHKTQLDIGKRACQMLKEGGLMAYSTCSLSPMEDEAVVAQLLREFKYMELVDLSTKLPGLVRQQGLSTWKVSDIHGNILESMEDVRDRHKKRFLPSLFPPNTEEAKRMNLNYAIRVLPHHNDTGGFFVALLKKNRKKKRPREEMEQECNESKKVAIEKLATEKSLGVGEMRRAKYQNKRFNTDSFIKLLPQPELKDYLTTLVDYYGLSSEFPLDELFSREKSFSKIYLIPGNLGRVVALEKNMALKPAQAGCRILTKHCNKMGKWDKSGAQANRKWRITQAGLPLVLPYMSKQIVKLSLLVYRTLLFEGQLYLKVKDGQGAQVALPEGSSEFSQVKATKLGNIICVLDTSSHIKTEEVPPSWRSVSCIRWPHKVEILINKHLTKHMRENFTELFGRYTTPYT